MEFDNRYASNGKGNAALATGIIGTVGTGLGILGGLGNGLWGNRAYNDGNCAPVCSENSPVNRYELQQEQTIASKDSRIALLEANTYGDQKLLEVYKYFDGELKALRAALCAQAVHNQKTEDSFVLARQDIAAVESRLNGKIEREAERRCCGDNAIVNYVNGTFYPKSVADVTVGTTTTAQTLYNPIPQCGTGCCNGNN